MNGQFTVHRGTTPTYVQKRDRRLTWASGHRRALRLAHSFCIEGANNPPVQVYDKKLCQLSYRMVRDFFAETFFGQMGISC